MKILKIVIFLISIMLIVLSIPTTTSKTIEKRALEIKENSMIPPLSFVMFFILGIITWILEPIMQFINFFISLQ